MFIQIEEVEISYRAYDENGEEVCEVSRIVIPARDLKSVKFEDGKLTLIVED